VTPKRLILGSNHIFWFIICIVWTLSWAAGELLKKVR
jgi:hypothetical protein